VALAQAFATGPRVMQAPSGLRAPALLPLLLLLLTSCPIFSTTWRPCQSTMATHGSCPALAIAWKKEKKKGAPHLLRPALRLCGSRCRALAGSRSCTLALRNPLDRRRGLVGSSWRQSGNRPLPPTVTAIGASSETTCARRIKGFHDLRHMVNAAAPDCPLVVACVANHILLGARSVFGHRVHGIYRICQRAPAAPWAKAPKLSVVPMVGDRPGPLPLMRNVASQPCSISFAFTGFKPWRRK
jgi:hypothetical protein